MRLVWLYCRMVKIWPNGQIQTTKGFCPTYSGAFGFPQLRHRRQPRLWHMHLVPLPPGAQKGWDSMVLGLPSQQPQWQQLLPVAAAAKPGHSTWAC